LPAGIKQGIIQSEYCEKKYMQIPMLKFKAHLSRYVGEAQAGKQIGLTSHRKVVARLIGVPAGKASWQGGKPAGAELRLQTQGTSVSAMVLEDRG
jgi:antitoxin (DNA-binding transcriptional repressor) of toxin-antitoxin stability system